MTDVGNPEKVAHVNQGCDNIVGKLSKRVQEAFDDVADEHPTQITYEQLLGALEIIKYKYLEELHHG